MTYIYAMLKHPYEVPCSVENPFSHPCTDIASSLLIVLAPARQTQVLCVQMRNPSVCRFAPRKSCDMHVQAGVDLGTVLEQHRSQSRKQKGESVQVRDLSPGM
jgi:hypothetical protein